MPTPQQLEKIRQKLTVGTCLWHFCEFVNPKPKRKILVLVGRDAAKAEYLFFVVNSEVRKFVADQPHLNRCQVKIDLRFHVHMNFGHECYINCLQPKRLPIAEIEAALVAKPTDILGTLNRAHMIRMNDAVTASTLMNGFDKPLVLDALKPTLN